MSGQVTMKVITYSGLNMLVKMCGFLHNLRFSLSTSRRLVKISCPTTKSVQARVLFNKSWSDVLVSLQAYNKRDDVYAVLGSATSIFDMCYSFLQWFLYGTVFL